MTDTETWTSNTGFRNLQSCIHSSICDTTKKNKANFVSVILFVNLFSIILQEDFFISISLLNIQNNKVSVKTHRDDTLKIGRYYNASLLPSPGSSSKTHN